MGINDIDIFLRLKSVTDAIIVQNDIVLICISFRWGYKTWIYFCHGQVLPMLLIPKEIQFNIDPHSLITHFILSNLSCLDNTLCLFYLIIK